MTPDSRLTLGRSNSGSRHYPLKDKDVRPTALAAVGHEDFTAPRNSCRCHICLSTLYYRHQLLPFSSSTSSSSAMPFLFGPGRVNFLPSRLGETVQSFRKSVPSEVDMRQMWSASSEGRGLSSSEASGDTGSPVRDLSTSKDDTDQLGQLDVVDGLRNEGPPDRPTFPTRGVADDAAAEPTAAASDVTGTCHDPRRRRRRLRLLPLLHTCRSCSLTFVSQLQLKFHADVVHRSADLDVAAAARPICCRVNQPDVRRS